VRAAIADLEHSEERPMARRDKMRDGPVAVFIRESLEKNGKNVLDFGVELGLERDMLPRMIHAGLAKLPLKMIKQVAAVLGVEPAVLLGVWIQGYIPGLLPLLDELGQKTLLSASERRLIQALREHTEGSKAEAVVCSARDLIAVVMV
jgi:hypothetical protein